MATDHASGSGADRTGSGETGRPDDPWRRIETEKPDRDAARKTWDESHDPSPEFEYAARPLGDDYGRDRPQQRELTAEQRAELEETFGRPSDELLALRVQDPRAGHNRDTEGRVLDHDGNPRPEQTPEHILREADRQANLHNPDSSAETAGSPEVDEETADVPRREKEPQDASELRASSDRPAEIGSSGDAGHAEQSLADRFDQLAGELRAGNLAPHQAADHLDQLRATYQTSDHPAEPEPGPEAGPSNDTTAEEPTTASERPVDTAGLPQEPSTYDSPSDVREALLRGKSAGDVRRELVDQPDAPSGEATTEVVREQDGYHYELEQAQNVPEGPEKLLRRSQDSSRYDRAFDEAVKSETVENLESVGNNIADTYGRLVLGERPQPVGSYLGIADAPVIYQTPREAIPGAAPVIIGLLAWVLTDRSVRWVAHRVEERRSGGEQEIADN